jgi:hypothetical protein
MAGDARRERGVDDGHGGPAVGGCEEAVDHREELGTDACRVGTAFTPRGVKGPRAGGARAGGACRVGRLHSARSEGTRAGSPGPSDSAKRATTRHRPGDGAEPDATADDDGVELDAGDVAGEHHGDVTGELVTGEHQAGGAEPAPPACAQTRAYQVAAPALAGHAQAPGRGPRSRRCPRTPCRCNRACTRRRPRQCPHPRRWTRWRTTTRTSKRALRPSHRSRRCPRNRAHRPRAQGTMQ